MFTRTSKQIPRTILKSKYVGIVISADPTILLPENSGNSFNTWWNRNSVHTLTYQFNSTTILFEKRSETPYPCVWIIGYILKTSLPQYTKSSSKVSWANFKTYDGVYDYYLGGVELNSKQLHTIIQNTDRDTVEPMLGLLFGDILTVPRRGAPGRRAQASELFTIYKNLLHIAPR